jgi:hypothetical protein
MIDLDARCAEARRLAGDGESQLATHAALEVLRVRPDHVDAFDVLDELSDDLDLRALDSFLEDLPDTPEFRPLAAKLARFGPRPVPTFDEPLVYDEAEFGALRVRLVELRRKGSLGEAVFRYRAAFAGYPSLTDSKDAVEQDPIPAPSGYAYPMRPATPAPDPIEEEVRRLLAAGNRTAAIRLVAERTGVPMIQAKAYVDKLAT